MFSKHSNTFFAKIKWNQRLFYHFHVLALFLIVTKFTKISYFLFWFVSIIKYGSNILISNKWVILCIHFKRDANKKIKYEMLVNFTTIRNSAKKWKWQKISWFHVILAKKGFEFLKNIFALVNFYVLLTLHHIKWYVREIKWTMLLPWSFWPFLRSIKSSPFRIRTHYSCVYKLNYTEGIKCMSNTISDRLTNVNNMSICGNKLYLSSHKGRYKKIWVNKTKKMLAVTQLTQMKYDMKSKSYSIFLLFSKMTILLWLWNKYFDCPI